MNFYTGLALKTLGGLSAIATVSASSWWLLTGDENVSGPNKFDQGLIDFLENKGDIQFNVKYKKGDETSYSNLNSFPEVESSISIRALIKIKSTDESDGGTLSENSESGADEKGKKQTLLGKNSTSNWSWECEIKFEKTGTDASSIKQLDSTYKDKVFKSDDQGLFGILKSANTTGTDTDKKNKKNKKKKFVEECSKSRIGSGSSSDDSIKSEIVIKLIKKDDSNLKFEKDNDLFS